MTQSYTTKAGDILDEIVFGVYGRTAGIVEQVLEVNRHIALADIGPVLPAGLVITLPGIAEPEVQTQKLIRLWE